MLVDETKIFEFAVRADVLDESMNRLNLFDRAYLLGDLCGKLARSHGCSSSNSYDIANYVERFLIENISNLTLGVHGVSVDPNAMN